MYSNRQIEIAEEHGVVLRAIPVRDLLPFDKIFLDTQEIEGQDRRACKVFLPASSFNCNCHKDVPVYKRRNKLVHTLLDDEGKKYVDDVFEVYAQRVRHSHYCSKLSRYRYESDYTSHRTKYRPKKNHVQLTGQDDSLGTVVYTFEMDETVFIVEDFGNTRMYSVTVETEEELHNLALYDEEIEDLDRYFTYALGWDSSCTMIHHHRHNEGAESIGEHVQLNYEHLQSKIINFKTRLAKINLLNEETFTESKEIEHDMNQKISELKYDMRYILRKFHFNFYDMGSLWDFVSGEMTFEFFVKCIDIIDEMEDRLKTKGLELSNNGLLLYHLTVDDYYWILYGDKLKRKYREVV
jgi:hypothetical protein